MRALTILALASLACCGPCNRSPTPPPKIKKIKKPPAPEPDRTVDWIPAVVGPLTLPMTAPELMRHELDIEEADLLGGVVRREGRVVGLDLLGLETPQALRLLRDHGATISALAGDLETFCNKEVQEAVSAGRHRRLAIRIHEHGFEARSLRCLGRLRAAELMLALPGRVTDEDLLQLARVRGIRALVIEPPGPTTAAPPPWSVTYKDYVEETRRRRSRLSSTGLAAIAKIVGLEALRIAYHPVDDRGLEQLSRASSLRILELAGTRLSDKGMAHLAGLKHLERLDLSFTSVTDAGLRQLSRVPRLRTLHLEGSRIGDSGMDHLQKIKTLRDLRLNGTRVGDAGLARLGGLSLQALHLERSRITDAGLAPLAAMRSLRRLGLPQAVTDAGLAHVAGLTGLESLKLERHSARAVRYRDNRETRTARVTDRGLALIGRLTTLRWLCLSFTEITDRGLAHLTGLRDLRSLELQNNLIGDAGLVHVGKLRGLRYLDLYDTDVTRWGIGALRGLVELRNLQLPEFDGDEARRGDREGNGDVLRHIGQLRRLTGLELKGVPIAAADLAHISGLTHLRYLHIDQTLDNEGLCHLRKMERLLSLSVTLRELSVDGERCLDGMQELTSLDLRGEVNRDAVPGLARLRRLESLSFCGFRCASFIAIKRRLPRLWIWPACKSCLRVLSMPGTDRDSVDRGAWLRLRFGSPHGFR